MTDGTEAAVELEGLTKDFATGLRGVRLRAVDHLSLRIGGGEGEGEHGQAYRGPRDRAQVQRGWKKPR